MPEIDLPENYATRVAARAEVLAHRFDTAFRVTDPERRARAEALLARIGSIDWQSEGYDSPENQRDLSIRFHWGHTHRFASDLEVVGKMGNRHLTLLAQFLEGFELSEDHFAGRRVLDVGCWTGGTTLSLKMLGADAVVALEEVRKYAETVEALARGVYGLDDVFCLPVSLYGFEDGRFDHVYFPGVIYHLSDPIVGLRRLFNRLEDGGDILVESAGHRSKQPICRFEGNRVYHEDSETGRFNRGGWNWFLPSAPCLQLWMEEAGFEQVRVYHSPVDNRVYGHGVRRRFQPMTRAGLSVPDIE